MVLCQRRIFADLLDGLSGDGGIREQRPLPVRYHTGDIGDGSPAALSGSIKILVGRSGKVVFQGNRRICGDIPLNAGVNPVRRICARASAARGDKHGACKKQCQKLLSHSHSPFCYSNSRRKTAALHRNK